MRTTRALIRLDRLCRNVSAVRKRVGPERAVCMPVKAGAYGHGAPQIAHAALEAGVSSLGVAIVSEAAELRQEGIRAPILLFSLPALEELPEAVDLDLSILVMDREFAGELARTAAQRRRRIPVHLKIDTGMGRMGCAPEAAAELASFIAAQDSLEYAGTATHLAMADGFDRESLDHTREQLARFRSSLEAIKSAGVNPGIVHAANSGAVILHEDAWFGMVRPGLLLYGYSPIQLAHPLSPAAELVSMVPVEPVMELCTRIMAIKRLKKGDSVSYGRTWTAQEDTIIALIPAGYGDGLPRALSGNFSVLIRDTLYPLAGRICMDQCMVNLGPDSPVRRWEAVTIFGGQAPSAAALASKLNTIPYEITCNINKRVPRIYLE